MYLAADLIIPKHGRNFRSIKTKLLKFIFGGCMNAFSQDLPHVSMSSRGWFFEILYTSPMKDISLVLLST
jgi:hypothetical protein